VSLIAWGALSLGAVYPWGYLPLLVGCASLGLVGLVSSPKAELTAIRSLTWALTGLTGAVTLQLIPLPRSILTRVSPATDALLRNFHLEYSVSDSIHSLSIRPADTILGLCFLVSLAVFLIGAAAALSRRSWRGIVRGLAFLGALLALIAIIQKAAGTQKAYGLWLLPVSRSPFGPFGNKNHFAGWMLMVLPISLGYFIGSVEQGIQNTRRGWRKRILWFGSPEASEVLLIGFATGIMGLSLVLTLSRSGIVAFLFALLIIGWATVRTQSVRVHKILGVGCLAVLAVTSIEWTGTDSLVARFAALNSSLAGRLIIWRDTVGIIGAFPITGTGLNTYGRAMLFYQTKDFPNLYVWAHNDYLQLAADGGFLLGIPIVLLIGLFVREVRNRFREGTDDRLSYCVRLGAVTGLVAIGLQDMVDFSLQVPGNAVLFTMSCAVAIARGPRYKVSRQIEA
jgi:O-antigen ligase